MDQYLVKTASSIEYNFEAHHFVINDDIVYFYDEEGEVIWVIKEWISLRRLSITEMSPDEFYENLKKDE